jgi:hypothetical protein
MISDFRERSKYDPTEMEALKVGHYNSKNQRLTIPMSAVHTVGFGVSGTRNQDTRTESMSAKKMGAWTGKSITHAEKLQRTEQHVMGLGPRDNTNPYHRIMTGNNPNDPVDAYHVDKTRIGGSRQVPSGADGLTMIEAGGALPSTHPNSLRAAVALNYVGTESGSTGHGLVQAASRSYQQSMTNRTGSGSNGE